MMIKEELLNISHGCMQLSEYRRGIYSGGIPKCSVGSNCDYVLLKGKQQSGSTILNVC